MKCIAIDDERMALEVIKKFCQRVEGLEVLTFTNPQLGMEQVRRLKPDLLFLDVEMGGVSGVELAKELPAGTSLIFTTAYAEYALDGFELNAVDFLHKPFSFSRFEKAIGKVEELHRLHRMSVEPAADEEMITVKEEYKNVHIRLADIVYVESMGNYVRIHRADAPPVLSQMSLKSIEDLLPSARFVRIHKSFIVAAVRIARYNRKQVVLYGGVELPVGRSYATGLVSLSV